MVRKQLMQYKTNEVGTASQARLVLMMYDGLIRFLNESKKRMEAKDIAGRGLYLCKAQRIVSELLDTLNIQQGGDIALQLEKLYNFLIVNITQANIKGDPKLVDKSLEIVGNLREAWVQVAANAQANATASSQRGPSVPRVAIQL